MKKLIISLIAIAFLIFIQSCENPQKGKEKEKKVKFSGTIVTKDGELISDAEIEINGKKIPKGDGCFSVEVDSADRYVINIRKQGFGLLSKVFHESINGKRYQLTRATVVSVNPAQSVVVKDIHAGECSGSELRKVNWSPFRSVPMVLDGNGRVVDFGFTSQELANAFSALSSGPPACNPGAVVSIPANTIVGPNNQPPQGNVMVSIATVDLYSEDGMPGDYSFIDREGKRQGFMLSMGAVLIDIYSEDGKTKYNLKDGASAGIKIPVDPLKLKFGEPIPDTIPLLSYNSDKGLWVHEGQGFYNRDEKAYEAKVKHFSEFNFDIEKTTPACIRFKQTIPLKHDIYKPVIVTVTPGLRFPMSWADEFADEPGLCNPGSETTGYHILFNLEPDNDVCVAFYENIATNPEPYGIYIAKSGASYDPVAVGNPPPCPYVECQTIPNVFEFDEQAVIVAGQEQLAGNTRIKWIANRDAASGVTYQLFKCTDGVACTNRTPIAAADCSGVTNCIIAATSADDPRNPTTVKELTTNNGVLPSGSYCIIVAQGFFGGDIESRPTEVGN